MADKKKEEKTPKEQSLAPEQPMDAEERMWAQWASKNPAKVPLKSYYTVGTRLPGSGR